MHVITAALLAPVCSMLATWASAAPDAAYPPAPRDNVIETLHGVQVPDPYRWLEDLDSAQTKAWVTAETRETAQFLNANPLYPKISKQLEQLSRFDSYGLPVRRGNTVFFTYHKPGEQQAILYKQIGLDGTPEVLLDPNALSSDGTISVGAGSGGLYFSADGSYLAYPMSDGGSDWLTVKIRDTRTGRDLGDELKWVKQVGDGKVLVWSPSGAGLYYVGFDAPAAGKELQQLTRNAKIFYHHLGTTQDLDQLVVFKPGTSDLFVRPDLSEDGRFLIVNYGQSRVRSAVYYKDLEAKDAPLVPLADEFDANYWYIGSRRSTLYFWTDKEAAHGRIVAISLDGPRAGGFSTVVPEGDLFLQQVKLVGSRFVVIGFSDARIRMILYRLDGKRDREIELPTFGSVSSSLTDEISGSATGTDMFYIFRSFSDPATVFHYDFRTGRNTIFRTTKLPFDVSAYETRQVFATSKDGTRIPIFLFLRKGVRPTGNTPVFLTAYGGFGLSQTPQFSAANILWLQMGGMHALAIIRGGSEYGEAWHRQGNRENKQNVFDDFAAAAHYLVDEHWTQPAKLAISGGSNGGLLMAAELTQHPELFAAVIPHVAVTDMLRFQHFTIGRTLFPEYGNPENAQDFQYLYRYSPLQNVHSGTAYPATLFMTAARDDRVVPSHSYKMTAALQAAQSGDAPILLRVAERSGHGFGASASAREEALTEEYTFIAQALGIHPQFP
jgi:prolyl oligopeptidase